MLRHCSNDLLLKQLYSFSQSHFKYSDKRTLNPVSNEGVNEGHIKDSKRQKVSSYGWQAMMACGNVAAEVDDTNISKSKLKQASALLLSNADTFSVGTNFSSSICAFCQTSEISEVVALALFLKNFFLKTVFVHYSKEIFALDFSLLLCSAFRTPGRCCICICTMVYQ